MSVDDVGTHIHCSLPGGRSRVIPSRFATKTSHFSGVDRVASPVINLSSLFASFAIEEFGHMTGICARVLKQRSVTRVRVDDELRIGQMRTESERIDGGNHDVVIPIGDKRRLRDLLQISVGLASGFLPGSHSVVAKNSLSNFSLDGIF